jgi:hypothetical protein
LVEIMRALEILTTKLLVRGYFVRGALVKGPLYHDANVVFGEALVRAYRLESEVVRFPRTMATNDVVADIETYALEAGGETFANWIKQADDGPRYVHTLRTIEARVAGIRLDNINKRPEDQESFEEFQKIQDLIQMRFNQSFDNPRHFEKTQWFADYWNSCLPFGLDDWKKIEGPGLNRVERIGIGPSDV